MFKRLFFLISIILVLGLVGNASADLVGRWNFDDQTANDSSGNDHHGTLTYGDATTNIAITYDADRDSNVLDCTNPAGHTTCSVVDCGDDPWTNIAPSITMAVWTRARTLFDGTANYLLTKGAAYQFTAVPAGLVRFYIDAHSGQPGGTTTYSTSSLLDGAWHHVVMSYDNSTGSRRVYFDGELEGEEFPATPIGTSSGSFVIGGRLATNFDHRGYDGFLDDVQLYDNAITYAEVRELAGNYKAYDPAPSNGELDVSLSLGSIWWKPGVRAAAMAGHKVYFGTDKGLVQSENVSVYKGTVDSNTYSGPPMGSLPAGVDYYWKVNAVNGVDEWPGNLWTFRTLSLKASEPRPVDTSKYVGTTRTRVAWRAGDGATDHAVYFGTNETLVTNGDASVYKGQFAVTSDPNWAISPALVADVKYYWRIDVNAPVVRPGNIWSFTASTPEADPNFVAWWKFDEKSGDFVWDATGREHHGTITQRAANTGIDIVYDADMDSNVLDYNNPPGHISGSVVDAGGDASDVIDPCWADIQTAVTVAGWTKLDAMHTTNFLLTKNGRYQLTATADDPDAGAGDGRIRAYTNEYVFDNYVSYSVSSVDDGSWHHLAFTYDSGTKERILYIDGDREAAETLTETTDPDYLPSVFPLLDVSTETLVIGGRLEPGYGHRGWNGLVKDVRIYDRALSRNEIHVIGVTDVNKAWGPYPRTATDPVSDWPLQLYWIPGDNVQGTQGHKVYFGTDQALVEANDVSVLLGTYDSNTAPAGSMRFGGTYYWKVNELNGTTEWPGKVWWFRMANFKLWDDFESYDFGGNLITYTWIPTPWTGAIIKLGTSGNNDPVNGGEQSMKYEYDNDEENAYYYYSEAYRDFGGSPQNWSYATGGVKSLQLNFYGETGNYPDNMYVVLNDGSNEAMKLYDGDLDNLKAGEWKEWDIALSDFTTVNLANVKKVYIGFGERGKSTPVLTRLTGTVYFDDFRVYPPRCVPSKAPKAAVLSGDDCLIDEKDVDVMTADWLDSDCTIAPSNPGDANLLGCWNFDDLTANDSSGKGHHGTITPGDANTSISIVYDADRDSNVLDVNNTGSFLNSVVDCGGDACDGGWANLTEQLSVAAWFTMALEDIHSSNIYMITKGNTWQITSIGTSDGLRSYYEVLSGTTLSTTMPVMDGDWHHVAITYDLTAPKRRLYIDGREVGDDEPTGGPLNVHTDTLVIGGRLNTSYNKRGWDGRIDDVRLYDDVLTYEEVVYLAGYTSPVYFDILSPANLTDAGDPCNSRFVNYKDFDILADGWLTDTYWP